MHPRLFSKALLTPAFRIPQVADLKKGQALSVADSEKNMRQNNSYYASHQQLRSGLPIHRAMRKVRVVERGGRCCPLNGKRKLSEAPVLSVNCRFRGYHGSVRIASDMRT